MTKMPLIKKATTVKNMVSGFCHAGIFPWDPTKVEDKKLTPSELFKKDKLMPDINMSVNEARGEAEKSLDKEASGLTKAESKSPEKENEALGSGDGKNRVVMTINPEGMINEIVIDGVKYRMVPLGEGDGQPKSTEAVKKTPATMNETKKNDQQNVNNTKCSKEENKLVLHFWNTKVYLVKEVPGDNEEKGKERAQRGERRA